MPLKIDSITLFVEMSIPVYVNHRPLNGDATITLDAG